METHAVILLAHGSRDPQWRSSIEAVAARARSQSPGLLVDCAYMELCAPSLAQCAEALIGQGARSINIVPMFLGMGMHTRQDLPRLAGELQGSQLQTRITLAPVIGEVPDMVDLMARIATRD